MNVLSVRFTGGLPGTAALAILVVAVALVLWAYARTRERLSRRQLAVLTCLRVLLVVFLVCSWAEPVFSFRAVSREKAPVLFLVDVSKSMSLRDTPAGQTRNEAALEPWLGAQHLAQALENRFAVRYFAFEAGTRPIESAEELRQQPPNGEMTLIGEAMASAAAQSGAEAFSGVVLLTDGADQSSLNPLSQARSLGAPVYTVAVGDVSSTYSGQPDLAIADVRGDRFLSAKAENQLIVRLEQRAYTGRTAVIEVRAGEHVLATAQAELKSAAEDVAVTLAPPDLGKQVFTIVATPFENEEIRENNTRQFTAIVRDKRLRVIYIEGTPRWEYKFLKRALEWDPAVAFTGFVQNKPGAFLRQGEKVREGALPVSREEFAEFQVIVLGDLAPKTLTTPQMEAIRDAVREDGRGLAFIPGAHAVEADSFADTPLAAVLPALPSPGQGASAAQGFVPTLTADGIAHPIFAGLDALRARAPALTLPGRLTLDTLSPGAAVLAVDASSAERGAVIVVQTAGKGRALTMGVDGTWRWRKEGGGAEAASVHARFWGQAIRWLAGREQEDEGGPAFYAYASSDYYGPGEEAILYARLRREQGQAAEIAITATIQTPTGGTLTTPLEFVEGSGGLYETHLALREAGEYVARVTASAAEAQLGEDSARFFVGQPFQEFDRVAMNEALLRSLAFETGGAFHTPGDAAAIPDEMMAAASNRALYTEKKVGRSGALYGLMVLCATVEWYLRRRRGLV